MGGRGLMLAVCGVLPQQEKGAEAADWTLEKASTATAVAVDKAQDLVPKVGRL